MNNRVLVVDDEESVRDLACEIVQRAGYKVITAVDGQEGWKTFFAWQPDLVVTDIRMPKINGWELLDRIREVSEVPVIILSALDDEVDTVRGLRNGADDFVVKPIRSAEFLARIEAALRKSQPRSEADEEYRDSALHIDFLRHRVYVRGDPVKLTALEFRLLTSLARSAGQVLSTDRLLDHCWPEGERGPEIVRVYIGYLRKKLKDQAKSSQLIETVRGFGYRYRAPNDD